MTSIVEKISFFKENLELFDDDMDKYKYLSLIHISEPTRPY